jgi:ribosomal protein S21
VALVPDEPIDRALTRLNKQIAKSGVFRELAHRRVGVTVAGRRKIKAKRALKRLRRDGLRANGGSAPNAVHGFQREDA